MNITIGILFKKLINKWLIILASIVLFASLGLFYAQVVIPEKYESYATTTVNYKANTGVISENDFEYIVVLSKSSSFIDFAYDSISAKGIAGIKKSDISSSILIERYMVGEVPSGNLIRITSSFNNAETAHNLLSEYTVVLSNYLNIEPIVGNIRVTLSDINIAPKTNVNLSDKTVKMVILGVFVGGVLSVMAIVISSVAGRKLKNITSFNDEFDMQVVGFINYDNIPTDGKVENISSVSGSPTDGKVENISSVSGSPSDEMKESIINE